MPIPDFTDNEKYLINHLKSSMATTWNSYMWGYLIGGALVAGYAAYHRDINMMLVAVLIICGFRVYEEYHQRRWTPVWRSILEKYEQAATAGDAATPGQDSGADAKS